jgi:hypothetical protein
MESEFPYPRCQNVMYVPMLVGDAIEIVWGYDETN